MKEIEIILRGRVQGINLKTKIKNFSEKNKISGFVVNQPDASLYLIAQGEEENLKKLIFYIESEHGFLKISEMNYRERPIAKKFENFEIVRNNKNIFIDKLKGVLNLYKTLKSLEKIPLHIAIIPDGNRRWATQKNLSPTTGHYKATNYKNLEEIFQESKKLGVKYLSIWGFSTENWKRDKEEVKEIFEIILKLCEKFKEHAEQNKIRFRHIGRKDRLPKELAKSLNELEEKTKNYDSLSIQLCLDYGGRDEILRAIKKIEKIKNLKKEITEEEFKNFLDTPEIPDPDLIIRTSGEKRLSGFMTFQSAYSELYFTDCLFPDFDLREFKKAIKDYSNRKRRFGG